MKYEGRQLTQHIGLHENIKTSNVLLHSCVGRALGFIPIPASFSFISLKLKMVYEAFCQLCGYEEVGELEEYVFRDDMYEIWNFPCGHRRLGE